MNNLLNTKKGDLSINMIIIIALAIIVLVIIVFIVSSRGKSLDDATKCTTAGGVCTSYCKPGYEIGVGPDYCTSPTKSSCCNPLGIETS